MITTRCGLDCKNCTYKAPCNCGGCIETSGNPFHGECPVAVCCQNKGFTHCGECPAIPCDLLTQYSCDEEHGDTPRGARIERCRFFADLKKRIVQAFNALEIPDMQTIQDMSIGKGSFVNLEYTLPSGQTVKLWQDDKIYYINQICKKDSERCYGLVADEAYLLVCEYGDNGENPEIIVFKRWN